MTKFTQEAVAEYFNPKRSEMKRVGCFHDDPHPLIDMVDASGKVLGVENFRPRDPFIRMRADVLRQLRAGLTGGGPKCFCGSQATKRIGESALMRQCQRCGKTMMWRLRDGEFKAMPIHVAAALDKRRAR